MSLLGYLRSHASASATTIGAASEVDLSGTGESTATANLNSAGDAYAEKNELDALMGLSPRRAISTEMTDALDDSSGDGSGDTSRAKHNGNTNLSVLPNGKPEVTLMGGAEDDDFDIEKDAEDAEDDELEEVMKISRAMRYDLDMKDPAAVAAGAVSAPNHGRMMSIEMGDVENTGDVAGTVTAAGADPTAQDKDKLQRRKRERGSRGSDSRGFGSLTLSGALGNGGGAVGATTTGTTAMDMEVELLGYFSAAVGSGSLSLSGGLRSGSGSGFARMFGGGGTVNGGTVNGGLAGMTTADGVGNNYHHPSTGKMGRKGGGAVVAAPGSRHSSGGRSGSDHKKLMQFFDDMTNGVSASGGIADDDALLLQQQQQNALFTTMPMAALNRLSGSGANGFGGGGGGGVGAELRYSGMGRWSGTLSDALETGNSSHASVSAAGLMSIIPSELGGNIRGLQGQTAVSPLAMSVASPLSSFAFRPPSAELSLGVSAAAAAGAALSVSVRRPGSSSGSAAAMAAIAAVVSKQQAAAAFASSAAGGTAAADNSLDRFYAGLEKSGY